jgi:hypothetical protein
MLESGNSEGESMTVPLTSCLTGLDKSVLQIKTKIVSCHTADSKQGGQWYSDTSPLVFPARVLVQIKTFHPSPIFVSKTDELRTIQSRVPFLLHPQSNIKPI